MTHPFRTALAAATVAALTGGLLVATTGTAAADGARPVADFNHDGYLDLAVSAPFAYVNGKGGAGQVVVLYGTASGISGAERTVLSQESAGVPGAAETGDNWGYETSAADFDHDGYTDLAVSAPWEDVSGDKDGGTVQIIWGSANGLSGGTTVKDPTPSGHDRFGYVLDAADYNGDDRADLAIGSSSATVQVYRGGFGRSSGATGGVYSVRPAILSGGDNGPKNLHSGDVNGDGVADLLVDGYDNQPDPEDYYWNTNYYVPGSASGLDATAAQKLPAGVITDIGDINSDGYGDIVIGVQWDSDVPGSRTGGKVEVINGSASGPSSNRTDIDQNSAGVPGSSETADGFGAELDLGDVNGDGHLDLAVGAPGESVDGVAHTGAVTVLYGAADGSGITGEGSQWFSQNSPGVPNSDEADDQFGFDIHLADLNNDGKGDLTVGASGENGGNGAVYALHSDGSRIAGSGGVSIYTSTVGVSTTGTPYFGVNFAG
ncbi:FG-GAP-like repeat-containing protein [Streptomyces meridianus]|uniref:FG-GAP-like repeat-containing protein n=1 Tax=Streptomyces meridianus TaxID=2938945 RepID=A0ABT0X769_9ACTN|nr:FG-GAP-like repeat-containing protein [Streptomyces meridianus]MCM2578379.1 FG-GAP-like repeat-containing protein [Streptomyces meridianus]